MGRVLIALLLLCALSAAAGAQEIANALVTVRAVRQGRAYTGFDLLDKGKTLTEVRFSSALLLTAARCDRDTQAPVLTFTGLAARPGSGVELDARDRITVRLIPGDPYPCFSFDLTMHAFDPVRWQAAAGKQPFHFLTLSLPEAEVWHQRGWLNATPAADPFPLLLDVHAGTPEISAYPYNRQWSYTPPLGAHPLPVIGLWAPHARRYAGFEFQITRLEDNSEKDIATGYCWGGEAKKQFVALVYPYGGQGYQQLVFPKAGDRIASHGTLLWSDDLPATDDPNRLFWSYLWEREQDHLPRVPAGVDLSWLPGGIRLRDFEGPPGGGLIGGVEGQFQVPGTKILDGWRWQNESPTMVAVARGDTARLQALERDAQTLLGYARRFRVGGRDCVYWEKPLEGAWTPGWGGKPVTTLHNANGFAAGRLFLGLYRDLDKKEYLPIVDGVLNWAEQIVWTRNEFADVPSSPFAIGGTLSASFCLDYYMTFHAAPDAPHREAARRALALARAFTYRYMVMWPSDNDRLDNRDSAFLWEPNSGRDWTGAACANEVFWNLDTLAQTAVHTGDPILMWALQGSLNRWPALYQEVYKDSLAACQPGDMTEGYGLYAGNIYGVGGRAPYGFASSLAMIEPPGDSIVRVLAGEKAALVFNKQGVHTGIRDYRYTAPGNLSFTLRGLRAKFNLALTVPYVDLSHKLVAIVREGKTIPLQPGRDLIRPPQAPWSLMLKDLNGSDRVIVGTPEESSPVLPNLPPLTQGMAGYYIPPAPGPFAPVRLPWDAFPDMSWDHLDAWAGLPRGPMWGYGICLALPPNGGRSILTKPATLAEPVQGTAVALTYSAGAGPPPAVVFADGSRGMVAPDTEALAWRAWPPMFTARLLVGLVETGGKAVTGIDPGGRAVWALSVQHDGEQAGSQGAWRAALLEGARAWRQMEQEEHAVAGLKEDLQRIPVGSAALLPPNPAGPAVNLLARAGFGTRGVRLTPEQMVDPAIFNSQRVPVAVYAGGEDYLDTVRESGDAAEAISRYVREGGTLLLLSGGPYPMYYASGPGLHRAEPLPPRLGLPLTNAIETAPEERLTVERVGELPIGDSGLPERFAYPSGDPRLRSIDRSQLPAGAHYTPLYRVRGASGRDYGDAAGLLTLPGGQGRVLYVSNVLLRAPDAGPEIARAAIRFLIAASAKTGK